MADLNIWRGFIFFCSLFAAARVLLVLVYLKEQWPADIPYNDLHDYGLAKIPQRLLREEIERFETGSDIKQNSIRIKKDAVKDEENSDNFKNLTDHEKKILKRGAKIDPQEQAVVWKDKKKTADFKNVDAKVREAFNQSTTEEFLINPPDACPEEGATTLLYIVVHSFPRNGGQRSAIRETWGKDLENVLDRRVRVVFFTPGMNPSRDVTQSMWAESYRHNDLIHTRKADSAQTFRSSSRALLSQFRWILQYCSKVKFVLFASDEMFVHVKNIVTRMKKQENRDIGFMKNFILGRVKKKAQPERSQSQWDFVPESAFPEEVYPNYCIAGAGFILSPLFMKEALPKAESFLNKVKTFPLSDVMLGIVTSQMNKIPMYNDEFRKMGAEAVYCDLKDALTLGDFNTPNKLRSVWANYTMHKTDHCPNPVPNVTEIEEWTSGVNNRPFLDNVMNLIHNPEELCRGDDGDNSISLLALVSTHPNNRNLRDAIRQTWSNPSYQNPLRVKTLFVMGRPVKETEEIRKLIKEEFENNGDLVQAQFRESFHNLTMKVILGLRWTSKFCPDAEFIYKGDDDMLVNFGFLTSFLFNMSKQESRELFLGHMMTSSPVVRTPSKYQCRRDQYPFKYFVPYFSGGGYIMAKASIKKMYEKALTTKFIPIDDAYAGILAFRAKIRLKHSGNFITTGFRKDSCRLMAAFNMHGFKRTGIMLETWKNFTSNAQKC